MEKNKKREYLKLQPPTTQAKLDPLDALSLDEDFFTPGADQNGHSGKIQANILPVARELISQLIQQKTFPYQTASDLCRHAVYKHLRYLQGIAPTYSATSVLSQVAVMRELLMNEQSNRDFENIIAMANNQVERFLNEQEFNEAVKLVHRLLIQVDLMPVGYWKTKYSRALNEKYKFILKQQGICLKSFGVLTNTGDSENADSAS